MALVLLGWWLGGRGSQPPAAKEDGKDSPPPERPTAKETRKTKSEDEAALAALRMRAIWQGLHVGQQGPPQQSPSPAPTQPQTQPTPKPKPAPAAQARPAPPAPERSDDRPRGARPYKPYDGTGRYAMAEGDGVRGIQGLATLARRYGMKPYAGLKYADGTWQTERVFFRDVDTGATLVRLTNDLWANELSYFGRNWSADGRLVIFRRRPGSWEASTATHGPMAVRTDGTGMRNIFRDYRSVLEEACSPADPNICFGIAEANKLVAFNLRTGKTSHVIRPVRDYWHLKVSLDGRYLMGRGNLNKGGRGLWVTSADGKEYHEIAVPQAIHDSFQFHPAQKKAMFWYEDHFKEGFIQCDFDGRTMTRIKFPFDWNHGDVGPTGGVHTDGYVMRIKGDEWTFPQPLFHRPGVEYYDHPTHYNGYLTWSPKDQLWVYGTRLFRRPFVSEIQAFHAEPVEGDVVNRYRVCYTGTLPPATLDHPQASPDGTKVLFNSNLFGRTDVYYVVARLPEVPRELTVKRDGSAVRLAWGPPAHHAEIAGYHVYRSDESGVNYVPLTRRPVQAPQYADNTAPAGKPVFYAVTAVEHSGLESSLSEEVAVDAERTKKGRIFLETEQGKRDRRMWVAHDGKASNRHYVWMRTRDGKGSVTLPVTLPDVPGPWTVWARVRGEGGVQFSAGIAGEEVRLRVPARADWIWAKFEGTLDPKPLKRKGMLLVNPHGGLMLTSSLYGSAVDCVAITNDPDFSPANSPRIRWPKAEAISKVEARAVSPYAVKLSWPRMSSDTFHHYNLYCGRKADFSIGQDTLVASPDRGGHLDYELAPGQTYYYRVTSVDRAGNESPPSPAVAVATPKVERVVLKTGPGRNPVVKVPRKGLYVLWLKLKPQPGGGVYIDVAADREPARIWTIACDCLSDEGWFTYDQWGRFTLAAGEHVLTINNRTKHLVQEVLLTNDLSYRPKGHVNMLRGW